MRLAPLLAAIAGASAIAVTASCVGDSPEVTPPVPDSGDRADGPSDTDGGSSKDGAPTTGPDADAATPRCDPKGTFDTIVPVAGVPSI